MEGEVRIRNSSLIQYFEDYFLLLQDLRLMCSTDSVAEDLPSQIQSKIIDEINNVFGDEVMGGESYFNHYEKEVAFIFAAIADEIFLNYDWKGKSYWERNLIEKKIFGSQYAGQEIFQRIDGLLHKNDTSKMQLGQLYLNLLGVGFEGKYRGFEDNGELQVYKKRLYVYVHGKDPDASGKLFHENYRHTVDYAVAQELPNVRNWYMIFAGIAATYVVFSMLIWFTNTWELSEVANHILTRTGYGGNW